METPYTAALHLLSYCLLTEISSKNITKNTPMQYTAIFHGLKNDNFQKNFFTIFLFLLKTLIVGTR